MFQLCDKIVFDERLGMAELVTQIKVGSLRWIGWVLLTLVFVFLLLGSVSSILGKGYYTRLPERILAGCLLLILIGVLTSTAAHWAKWICAFFVYLDIKSMVVLLLGKRLAYPPVAAPRVVTAEYLLMFLLATVLTFYYVDHKPTKADAIGLIALLVGVCCSVILDSGKPAVVGTAASAIIRLAHLHGVRRRLKLAQISW
jgi:hypothetical protein